MKKVFEQTSVTFIQSTYKALQESDATDAQRFLAIVNVLANVLDIFYPKKNVLGQFMGTFTRRFKYMLTPTNIRVSNKVSDSFHAPIFAAMGKFNDVKG